MDSEVLVALMLVALIAGILSGAHLAAVLGTVGIVFGVIGWGWHILPIFATRVYDVMTNYLLVAVPLFVFMGFIISRSGLAEDLFAGTEMISRRLKGGLVVATILFGTIFAMCTGVVAASVITAGVLCLPSMLSRNYPKGVALGAVGAGGTLGILIPPSVMLIFYASETGLSTGRLFAAAYLPGILLASLFVLYVVLRFTFFDREPSASPGNDIRSIVAGQSGESGKTGAASTGLDDRAGAGAAAVPAESDQSDTWRALRAALPLFGLIFAVVGTIIFGIATPTEASAAGAFGALVIAAAYRRLTWPMLKASALETIETVGMIGFLIVGVLAFTSAFLGIDAKPVVSDIILGISGQPIVILLTMLAILFVLGMLLDWIPILYITLPVFIPIVDQMGWDPLWFALLVVVCLQTSWLTPPFGFALFFLRGIAPPEVTYFDIVKGCFPFMLCQLVGLGILILFPQIILFLPGLVM
ncbi:MAG: TRAP transporter large permease subunit [Albidovulum sp.]|nr:TRAP transporter large permease subunit [Albidovulum sp.]